MSGTDPFQPNPYQNPYQATHELGQAPSYSGHSHSYRGIGRLVYFFGAMGISFAQNGLVFAIVATSGEQAGAVAAIPVMLLALAGTITVASLRMINQGSSGWWGIGITVPLLNIFVGLRCLICPEGYADHQTLDTAGKVIGGSLIATVILGVLAVCAAIVFMPS